MREWNDALHYPIDAIAMLTADHRLVTDLFAQYASAGDFSTKQVIAEQVFTALEVYAQLASCGALTCE